MNKVIDIDSFLGLSEGQLQTLDTLNVSGDESVHLAKLFKRNDSSYEKFFENLKRCHRLVDLSLSGQELESIPEGVFSQLRQLRVLDLSENELSHLPDDFNALAKTLEDLGLEDNKLEILPNLSEFKNIKQLDCSGNIILDSLPDLPPFGRLDIDLVKKQSFLCVDEKLKDQVPEHLKPIMSYESTRYFFMSPWIRRGEPESKPLVIWGYSISSREGTKETNKPPQNILSRSTTSSSTGSQLPHKSFQTMDTTPGSIGCRSPNTPCSTVSSVFGCLNPFRVAGMHTIREFPEKFESETLESDENELQASASLMGCFAWSNFRKSSCVETDKPRAASEPQQASKPKP